MAMHHPTYSYSPTFLETSVLHIHLNITIERLDARKSGHSLMDIMKRLMMITTIQVKGIITIFKKFEKIIIAVLNNTFAAIQVQSRVLDCLRNRSLSSAIQPMLKTSLIIRIDFKSSRSSWQQNKKLGKPRYKTFHTSQLIESKIMKKDIGSCLRSYLAAMCAKTKPCSSAHNVINIA